MSVSTWSATDSHRPVTTSSNCDCPLGNITTDQIRRSPAFDPDPQNYTTAEVIDPVSHEAYNLTYWVNGYGEAIAWGDIVVGFEEEVLKWSTRGRSVPRGFGVVGNGDSQWPSGIIKYRFSSQAIQDSHVNGIESAFKDWRSWAPYLQFVEYPIGSEFVPDIVTITEDGGGCYYSGLGYYSQHKHINFAPNTLANKAYLYACYRHEFGHAIGLEHEHQRPDWDKYIRYNCDAVQGQPPPGHTCTEDELDCCKNPDSSCCQGVTSQLLPVNDSRLRTYGAYDMDSIMHYGGSFGGKGDGVTLRLVLEPIWVPEWFPDIYAFAAGLFFRGLYSINKNYWIKATDAAAVCGIYQELCKKAFPDGLPGKPIEPPPQTATVTTFTSSTTSTISRTTHSLVSSTATALVEKSGWKFTFGLSEQVNAWTPVPSYFVSLTAGGPRSVNTRCLTVQEVVGDFGEPQISAGSSIIWETRLDPLSGMEADTCCIILSAGAACEVNGVQSLDNCVGFNEGSPFAIKSFKVHGCTGLYVPE